MKQVWVTRFRKEIADMTLGLNFRTQGRSEMARETHQVFNDGRPSAKSDPPPRHQHQLNCNNNMR